MTVKTIALDIETVPVNITKIHHENVSYLMDKDKNARTQRFFKKYNSDDVEDMKKPPEFDKKSIGRFELNQIICCCMYDGEEYIIYYTIGNEKDNISDIGKELIKNNMNIKYYNGDIYEADMLKWINETINRYGQIITFNGNSFDLPMIRWRSKLNGVKTNIKADIKPWDISYTDLRYSICGSDKYAVGDLPYWCRVFGVDPPEWGGNAEHKDTLKELWNAGEIDKIIKGCCSDVKSTWGLYQKIK